MVSLDRVFELLSKERRRYALYYLDQQEGPVSVNELATFVAEQEAASPTTSLPDDHLAHIELELYHTDLPKAAGAEYIQYDPNDGVIELTGPPTEFHAILTIAKVIERPDRDL